MKIRILDNIADVFAALKSHDGEILPADNPAMDFSEEGIEEPDLRPVIGFVCLGLDDPEDAEYIVIKMSDARKTMKDISEHDQKVFCSAEGRRNFLEEKRAK